jgi:hypothetical protein
MTGLVLRARFFEVGASESREDVAGAGGLKAG